MKHAHHVLARGVARNDCRLSAADAIGKVVCAGRKREVELLVPLEVLLGNEMPVLPDYDQPRLVVMFAIRTSTEHDSADEPSRYRRSTHCEAEDCCSRSGGGT